MRRPLPSLALALLALAPLPAPGQEAEDDERALASAAAGEEVARRWCAACHLVAPDQLLGSADAPSFAAIAEESEGDFDWLPAFLADPHPAMPRMSLSRQQLRDLAAHLRSLREEPDATG